MGSEMCIRDRGTSSPSRISAALALDTSSSLSGAPTTPTALRASGGALPFSWGCCGTLIAVFGVSGRALSLASSSVEDLTGVCAVSAVWFGAYFGGGDGQATPFVSPS